MTADSDEGIQRGSLDWDRAHGILNSLLSELPGVVYRCRNDRNRTMLGATSNIEDLTGYAPFELIRNEASSFGELIHPDDRKRVWRHTQAAVEEGIPFRSTYRIRTRKEEEHWILDQGQAVREDGTVVLTGYIQDVTAPYVKRLRESEEELFRTRSQADRLSLLQSVTAIANEERRLESGLRAAVPIICTSLGFSIGHVLFAEQNGNRDLRSSDIWHLDGSAEGLMSFRKASEVRHRDPSTGLPGRVMESHRAEWTQEGEPDLDFLGVDDAEASPVRSGIAVPVISRDRTLAVLELYTTERGTPDPEIGSLLEQIGVQLGRVWERETFAQELQKTRTLFRQITESIDNVFWVTTPEKDVMEYVSPAYRDIWGRDPDELYDDAHRWMEHIHPDDRERVRRALSEQVEGTYEEEYRIVRPDGEVRWIWDRGFPVEDETGDVYRIVGVAEDISERKKLEAQLRQSQKMEAVGRLAGGIAHDFNNLLTVIRSEADLLLIDLPDESRLIDDVEIMIDASDRAAHLTRQLLAFSREQVLHPQIVDLNGIIETMKQLLVRILGEDVDIRTDLTDEIPPIRIDPGQLEQVLMNLAVNARDAMPNGGRLSLSTSVEDLSPEEVGSQLDLEPGTHVRLDVSDTGMGMDEKTLKKAFEPFFTTNEKSKGTGLGLAVSYGIVQQSGGTIQADSVPGEGTSFVIRFPPAKDERATVESGPGPVKESDVAGITGTILIVEDDPSVRRVTRRILERADFQVRTAANAEAGLRLLEEGDVRPDLLLTDLVLPQMNGREFLDRVRERYPEIRPIVMSGDSERPPKAQEDPPEKLVFIPKPFTPDGLLKVIQATLAEE